MKRLIAGLCITLALSACSTDVHLEKTSQPGKCTQERSKHFLGFIQTSRNQYIVNC